MSSMKAGNKEETLILREIKSKFLEFETSGNGKELDEGAEANIIRKIFKEHQETKENYEKVGNTSEVESENKKLEVLEKFLPKEPTENDIRSFIESTYPLGHITKPIMGAVIKEVKEKFPTANGKLVADVVKSFIQ